ncbi:MAG TPA: membrane protein insertion efficiency factor YidD [Dehalococcoidia bacterium]|nr:membrane protein insertion efficiency factor YidD [Dehalococcoidia bacterium]
MKHLALLTIKGYQLAISPYLPSSCRFNPSCSQYTYESINKYGILKGTLKGMGRIGRCTPFGKKGHDPVN